MAHAPGRAPRGSQAWAGELLGRWKESEVAAAGRYPECRGLPPQEIEDLYQETTLRLLKHEYVNEEHLRWTLRKSLRRRALNSHRDTGRHTEILARHAPGMHALAQAAAAAREPETVAILDEDRLIVAEFMAELDPLEQVVFRGLVEGARYRAIAAAEGIEVNLVRNAARALEQKRKRFELLYRSGRLCGFRASTIASLQRDESTSAELAKRAFAHLESCPHCRAEHRTNARRLRARFERQAVALLPLPALAGRAGWVGHSGARLRAFAYRFLPEWTSLGGGGSVREQVGAVLLGGGAAVKVAAGVAAVTVAASTAITTHLLADGASRRAHASIHRRHSAKAALAPTSISAPPLTAERAPSSEGTTEVQKQTPQAATHPSHSSYESRAARREPSGFAYLGVPAGKPPSSTAVASSASVTSSTRKGGGGEFSP